MFSGRMLGWIAAASLCALAGLAVGAPAPRAGGEAAAGEGIEVLRRRCIACHNPDKKSGGIDLTTRAGAQAAGASGADDPKTNRLVRAVVDGKMPPTGKLPAPEISQLRAWVRGGATYPQGGLRAVNPAERPLWSLQPVRRPPVPRTKFDALAKNPVDRFIFRRLEQKGLRPSPPASRAELLRRVTIDLTGLPPTPEELAAFLADRDPKAYEEVVDRLLASPAYGERWAQHWLDVVRYGESHGYEQNHLRPNAWPYRDYVIRALNEDRPYDRFVTEQLAGDAVAEGDPLVEAATGFIVAGVHDTVGNQTVEGQRQQRANDLDDMVSAAAETFLGMTAGCAKCHDHKFDPIPQQDYYRLAAVFAGVRHGERVLGGGAPAPGTAKPGLRWTEEFAPVPARFVRFTVAATVDGTEPCLDELEVYGPDGKENLALAAAGAKPTASSLLPGHPMHQVEHLNDGRFGNDRSWISNEKGRGWAQLELARESRIDRVVWSRDAGERPRFTDRVPVAYRVEVSLEGERWQVVSERGPRPGVIGKGTPAYAGLFGDAEPVHLLRRGDVMQRGEEVTSGALSCVGALPADLAEPGATDAERRLALARWITDPRNPLTARVIVNRIWHGHFGRGLVGTPSDFGHNGEKPTHPELLDYLAGRFAAAGSPESKVLGPESLTSRTGDSGLRTLDSGLAWSLKRLHRLLVTSYTYRQSSRVPPDNPESSTQDPKSVDAGNQLLWRMPLRRMDAETIRDAILAASGKLDRRMGGPGFRLFNYRVVNVAIYEPAEEFGPETWRRSIYHQRARAIRDGLLGTFDCPESSQRTPRRESTTTALQALSLLNGPFIVQQSGFMAERVRSEAGEDPKARVRRAFQLSFGRLPNAAEGRAALDLNAAQDLPALCRALLNANEFLYY